MGLGVCLLAALAACATPRSEESRMCQSAVEELRECAAETREWQSQEASERPQCISEDAATPGAAELAGLEESRYADQPEGREALQDATRRLGLISRLLKYENPAAAEALLRDLEGRCAELP